MQTIDVPGFGDQAVAVQLSNGFNTTKLFVNGQPAPPGPKRGQYLLRRPDGTDALAFFKAGFPDPVPILMIDNQPYRLAKALTWYQWVWAAFPIVLLFVGGAIGGGLGAGALFLNTQLLRSDRPAPVRYLLSGLVSFGAFAVFILLASLLPTPQKR